MTTPDFYDEDYFQRGIETGKSLYTNFRWMPEASLSVAMLLKMTYPDKSILDWGCGLGYTVKALHILDVKAWNYDSSPYCIKNGYQVRSTPTKADVVYCKDVLEHIEYDDLPAELAFMKEHGREAFIIIPLGDDGKYRIDILHKDTSHIIAENEGWWTREFTRAGWKTAMFEYQFGHLKWDYIQQNPRGYGFFMLK